MVELKGIMGIPLLKKSRFTGSDGMLRYVLEKRTDEDGQDRLAATAWHGLLCSDATPEEEKEPEYFPFTEEGLEQARQWLNGLDAGPAAKEDRKKNQQEL